MPSGAEPLIAPGYVDVHVHGWGGHDAMGDRAALDGMARRCFVAASPPSCPPPSPRPSPRSPHSLSGVRAWLPDAPADGAEPLGLNLEGPFLAAPKRGAHDLAALLLPSEAARADLEPLLDGLRLITIAPELPGAPDLIRWFHDRGVAVSLGHSAATLDEARAGYAAGATGHDPPVQRDDRARPPGTWARARRPAR